MTILSSLVHRLTVACVAVAGPVLTSVVAPPARAGQPPLEAWHEQREQLLRLNQQQQLRLQQQVQCLQKAGTKADLERCRDTRLPGWRHGSGMGGWGCPMW